jgi:hypothetical protein
MATVPNNRSSGNRSHAARISPILARFEARIAASMTPAQLAVYKLPAAFRAARAA